MDSRYKWGAKEMRGEETRNYIKMQYLDDHVRSQLQHGWSVVHEMLC